MFVYYALLLYTVEIAYTVQLCIYIHHLSLLVKFYLACKMSHSVIRPVPVPFHSQTLHTERKKVPL